MEEQSLTRQLESSPYWSLLGLRVHSIGEGRAELVLPVKHEFTQVFGTVHGGVLGSLLDSAGGVALRRVTDLQIKTIATVEMKLNYLNPVTEGDGEIIATGRVLKKGNTIAVCLMEARTASGTPVAAGIGTYALVDRKK